VGALDKLARMHRARRIIGWFLAALVTLFVAALLAVNLYVQSQGTQGRIQQELSQRLDMPLRIQRISVTPWGGLRLSGITIPQTNPSATPAFLEASSFRLLVRFDSIFRGPLVIKEVALVKPQVSWPQNAAGKWRLPSRVAEQISPPPKSSTSPAESRPVRVRESPGTPLHDLPIPQPEIKRVKLIDGSFHFFDRQNADVALFDGVEFSSVMHQPGTLLGGTRMAKIALRDRVFLSNLRAAFQYDGDALELSEIKARVARGELDGDFSMQPQVQESPFTVRASFARVQASELVANTGASKDIVRGVLEGTLEASGKLADANALSGTGTISLRGGHVQQFALLAAIGQVLQIEELTRLDLDEASAKYRLVGQSVLIDEMVLRSPNLRLNATGTVTFDGKLALESTLTINDKIRGQLFRAIRENFATTNQPGEYSLPFHIGGTLEKPKTDLMQRAVGVDLKNIAGVIDALFGKGKNKKKNAEPPAPPALDANMSTAPPASPIPSPTPSSSISPASTPAP
jgi:AsmA-like C-terminal region/AsmA family